MKNMHDFDQGSGQVRVHLNNCERRKVPPSKAKWARGRELLSTVIRDFKQSDTLETIDFFNMAHGRKMFLSDHLILISDEPARPDRTQSKAGISASDMPDAPHDTISSRFCCFLFNAFRNGSGFLWVIFSTLGRFLKNWSVLRMRSPLWIAPLRVGR